MAGAFAHDLSQFVLEATYRFPVLAHWSFTATNEGDFRSLAQGLDVGLLGTEVGTVWGIDPAGDPHRKVEHVNLAAARRAAAAATRRRSPSTGHVGLPQTTRRGEAATAWYRGPFVPVATDRDLADEPMPHVSDQLRTAHTRRPRGREPRGGVRDRPVARPVAAGAGARRSSHGAREQFGAARAPTTRQTCSRRQALTPDASRLAGDLGRLVGLQLATLAGRRARDAWSARAARSPIPAGPIELRGALDRVVADGLGIDLATVTERRRGSG